MSKFGAELKRRRLAAGMSLSKLATTIHFTKGYLSKIENGKVRVSQSLAEACDRILDAKGELVALSAEAHEPVRRHSGGMIGLPDSTRHFVGRKPELESLLRMLTEQRTVRVCVLHGMAGAGKTALAVAAARAATGRFPDGCLFFDLRGHTPETPELEQSEVMYRVLTLLGVQGETIPSDVDGRANLLQDCLRYSRVLLVFDNVRSAGQLHRVLPSAPGCRVLITSRSRLPVIDDAWHLPVGMLADDEAMAVFRSVVGDRMPDDEDTVRDILARCGMLPLAIRIAGARFAGGGWTITRLRDRMNDEAKQLSVLDNGERSVIAAFSVSYRMLADTERRIFGLLALHPGGPAEIASVSALAGLDADDVIDRLHDTHLVTRHADGHVELHDLVRVFATQRALPEIPPRDQDAAAVRLVRHLLSMTVAADEFIEPYRFRPAHDCSRPQEVPFDDSAGALRWLRGQWPVLVEIVELAGARRMHAECWQLAFVLRAFFYREKLFGPWMRTHRRALGAAESVEDMSATGMILNNLGTVQLEIGDMAEAINCHRRAYECFTEAQDERGATDAMSSLAWARLYQGHAAESLRDLITVLSTYRREGRTRNVVIALRGVALALTSLGRFTEALTYAEEARDLAQLPVDVLMCVNCIAWIHFRAGRHEEARGRYLEGVDLAEVADSDHERTRARNGLGNVAAALGDTATASRWWAEADEYEVDRSPVTLTEVVARATLSERVTVCEQPR